MYIDMQPKASRKCHNQYIMAVVDICECLASTANLNLSEALLTALSNRSGILELCGGVSLLVTYYCLAKSCSSMSSGKWGEDHNISLPLLSSSPGSSCFVHMGA